MIMAPIGNSSTTVEAIIIPCAFSYVGSFDLIVDALLDPEPALPPLLPLSFPLPLAAEDDGEEPAEVPEDAEPAVDADTNGLVSEDIVAADRSKVNWR